MATENKENNRSLKGDNERLLSSSSTSSSPRSPSYSSSSSRGRAVDRAAGRQTRMNSTQNNNNNNNNNSSIDSNTSDDTSGTRNSDTACDTTNSASMCCRSCSSVNCFDNNNVICNTEHIRNTSNSRRRDRCVSAGRGRTRSHSTSDDSAGYNGNSSHVCRLYSNDGRPVSVSNGFTKRFCANASRDGSGEGESIIQDSNKTLEDSVCDFYLSSGPANSPTQILASSSLRIASGVSVSYSSEKSKNFNSQSRANSEAGEINLALQSNTNTNTSGQRRNSRGNTSSEINAKTSNFPSAIDNNSSSNNSLDEVFDTVPDFPKLEPLSKLVSSYSSQQQSSSTSSSSSSSSSSNSRLPLLWRRKRSKQNSLANNKKGAASFLLRQSSIVEEDEIQQQQQQQHQQTKPQSGPSIIQKIFLRAREDLHSWDKRKVKNAKLMLKRLGNVGVCIRPKAMSFPPPQSPIPTITITSHSCLLGASPEPSHARTPPKKETGTLDIKRNGSGALLQKRHLLASASIPDLSSHAYIPPQFLDDTGCDAIAKRRDSVSRIRKKSLVQAQIRRPSNCSLGSQQIAPPSQINRRSSSLCGSTTTSRGTVSPAVDIPFVWREDSNLLTWSKLLASIPEEDRKNAHIRRHQIVLPIPVCLVGEDKPLSFTSMEVIEQTLRRLHPDVIVKKLTPAAKPVVDPDHAHELDDQTHDEILNSKDRRGGRRLSIQVSNNRRVSINTCINSMQSGLGDYDKQLTGVKSVGTYAEEEELKVLIAKRDAIACVINAMNNYPEKEELQLSACISLEKMASVSESNCVHILHNEGLKPICNTLRLHNYNSDIVRPLLSTIAFISTAHDLASHLVTEGIHTEVLQAMAIHGQEADIVKESCYIIGNLLTTVDIAQRLMYAAAVHTIIRLVENFPEDAKILENACRTLGSFALYDETCQDVANAGATRVVLNAITSPAANAGVIECGCWALASLTASVATCEEVVQLSGVKVIVKVLTEFPREEGLQDYAIRVLCNLSQQDETVLNVSTAQVFGLLYSAMMYFSGSVELLEIILVTVCQIFTHHEVLCRCVVDTCFVRDLVNTMMELSDNTIIQEHGCKVIGNLAVEDDLRRLAESQGASKAVISALLTNNTDANIQEIGCMAIMNLTADNKENKVRIKNAGVVSAILNSLQEFQCDATVVLSALKALGNLISLEEVCHLLLDEKGLGILIALTDTFEDDQELLTFLVMVFCGISELPDLKEEEVEEIDETLFRISKSSQYCEQIAQYICQAREKLIRTPQGRETFTKKRRLASTLCAMQQFPANVQIHRTCCKLIAVVSFYIDSKKRLITETTVNTVLKSMELFPFDLDLQIIACGTISCIVQKIAILKHELIGHGGIALMRKAVYTHRTESRLAAMSLITLGHVLPIDSSTYPAENRIALDLILMCMKNFPENEEVQLVGCHALGQCQMMELNDTQDLSEIVIQALRRHGEDPEMQRRSAQALKNANHCCSQSSSIIQNTLKSPKIYVTDEFWKIWDGK